MRQALSISFPDKAVAADRAELRATMTMSGVFDFHHFAEAADEESDDSRSQSTQESGDNTAQTAQMSRNIKNPKATFSAVQGQAPQLASF
jgi:hypothetical protein